MFCETFYQYSIYLIMNNKNPGCYANAKLRLYFTLHALLEKTFSHVQLLPFSTMK